MPARCASWTDVGLDHEIVAQKLRRIGVVRQNAADFRRSKNDRVWFLSFEKILHSTGVAQIDLGARGRDDLGVLHARAGA